MTNKKADLSGKDRSAVVQLLQDNRCFRYGSTSLFREGSHERSSRQDSWLLLRALWLRNSYSCGTALDFNQLPPLSPRHPGEGVTSTRSSYLGARRGLYHKVWRSLRVVDLGNEARLVIGQAFEQVGNFVALPSHCGLLDRAKDQRLFPTNSSRIGQAFT